MCYDFIYEKIVSYFSSKSFFCNISYSAITGKGDLKMFERSVNHFIHWIKTKEIYEGNRCKPSMFIISSDGEWTQGNICCYASCQDTSSTQIVEQCERDTGVTCGVFSIRRTIYWTNEINTKTDKAKIKSRWSDQKIKDELKRLNFYD